MVRRSPASVASLAPMLGIVLLPIPSCSLSIGALRAGMLKFGVRWKTMSEAPAARYGMDWIADEPVPITPTRLPAKSTPSWGQRPV